MSNIDDYFLKEEIPFLFSTHLVIDEIRARIAEKKINKDDYEIWVEDSKGELHLKLLTDSGRSSNWYDTEEVMDDILLRMIEDVK